MKPEPAPASPEPVAASAEAVPLRSQAVPPAAVIRVRPAWWVPFHAFAVLAARLAYPLALLGAATWLVSIIIRHGASAWFIVAVIIVIGLLLFAAPRDPEA